MNFRRTLALASLLCLPLAAAPTLPATARPKPAARATTAASAAKSAASSTGEAAVLSLPPAALAAPNLAATPDLWPTYNGDFSGRRFSPLAQINTGNVGRLTMVWAFQSGASAIKATPLLVHGILYLSAPDQVWALDARNGKLIWSYHRPSEGDHLASRGLGMLGHRLFFGTPDAHLICLDARTGKLLWDQTIADVKFGYYLSVAPLVIHGRVIIGTSGDTADVPHFLEALNPDTGAVEWRWNSIPASGQPGADTWPSAAARHHGGGPMWMPGTYDPELNLLYWGSGNPHPVLAGTARPGANLYTCSIVALNPDTGKLVWAFQASPHDTHDWDAVETPVLFDALYHGRRCKLLAQASRNGYYFLLDRVTGQALVSHPFNGADWAQGLDAHGSPQPAPHLEPKPDGALVHLPGQGATNWMAPSFDPQTGLFYVTASSGASVWYLTLGPDHQPTGHQGGDAESLTSSTSLLALDYRSGRTVWSRSAGDGRGNPGILTTAGHLLFSGDLNGNVFALDAATGKVLWHAAPGESLSNSPSSYQLDGRQFVLTAAGGILFAWALPQPTPQR